jgi:hypothetical protein
MEKQRRLYYNVSGGYAEQVTDLRRPLMHRLHLKAIVTLMFLSLVCGGPAGAASSKDERNLEREAKRLSDTAAKPDGEKAVLKELSTTFKTGEPAIRSLRDRTAGYGETAIVLSLAQTLPGGATDANVQKVLALRQGPPVMGWGQIARQLNVKLGRIVSQVRKTANNSNREIKSDHARAGKDRKEAPPEQKSAPQESVRPNNKGEGRLLRQGGSAQ